MSELSPDEKTPSPPVARRRRPKAKAYTPHRANNPIPSSTRTQNAAEPTTSPKKTTATNASVPPAAAQPAPADVAVAGDAPIYRVGNLTVLSRPIIIWASIIGVASLVLSIGTNVFIDVFGSTTALANQNTGLLNSGYCLSEALLLAVFPFLAGWRATQRQGTWREGAMTGIWSALLAQVLGLIASVIFAAIIHSLDKINGAFFEELGEALLMPVLFSFMLGSAGGWYSTWQRRRALRAQEMLTSSS